MKFKEKVKGIGRDTFWIFSSKTNQAKYSSDNYPELFQIYIHPEHNNIITDIYIRNYEYIFESQKFYENLLFYWV